MKIKFRDQEFRDTLSERQKKNGETLSAVAKIKRVNAILDEWRVKYGLTPTARQLYYQMVKANIIPNTVTSYKNFTGLLTDARYAGLIDWDAIEDRIRTVKDWKAYEFENIEACVEDAIRTFRLPRWNDQPYYIELWGEKDAVSEIIEQVAWPAHVPCMVNRGYSSAPAMFRASRRFIEAVERGKNCILFYLGDHDPSGEDMVGDIGRRLREFGAELEVRKLALTMDQVEEFDLPPNPAKHTDSRYEGYAEKHDTDSSWELDALDPGQLRKYMLDALAEVVDEDEMERIKAEEKSAKKRLRHAVKHLDEIEVPDENEEEES